MGGEMLAAGEPAMAPEFTGPIAPAEGIDCVPGANCSWTGVGNGGAVGETLWASSFGWAKPTTRNTRTDVPENAVRTICMCSSSLPNLFRGASKHFRAERSTGVNEESPCPDGFCRLDHLIRSQSDRAACSVCLASFLATTTKG